jgi:uncharacterized membrane protein
MRTLKDIQTRHEELVELEKSIAEVHQLFVEISLLVHSQVIFFLIIYYATAGESKYLERQQFINSSLALN